MSYTARLLVESWVETEHSYKRKEWMEVYSFGGTWVEAELGNAVKEMKILLKKRIRPQFKSNLDGGLC